jgi:hypothetical protein
MPALFFPGIGKGRAPRPKTARDRLERLMCRISLAKPDNPELVEAREQVLDVVEIALAALPRSEAAVSTEAVASPVASTSNERLFFTDAAREARPGYAVQPKTRRAEIEAEIYRLQARRWSDADERHEIEQEIERLKAELAALERGT